MSSLAQEYEERILDSLRPHEHAVELNNDLNVEKFAYSTRIFKSIVFAIYAGRAWPTSGHSDNHINVYLPIEESVDDKRSVRLDIRSDIEDEDRKGYLVWSELPYSLSTNVVTSLKFDLPFNMHVSTFYALLRNEWGMHRYNLSGGGSGCHYWSLAVSRRLADKGLLEMNAPSQLWDLFSFQYSRREDVVPLPIHMVEGRVLDHKEWCRQWFECAEDRDGDDDVGYDDVDVEEDYVHIQ